MSLETAIQENTKAIHALIEHMKFNVAQATPVTIPVTTATTAPAVEAVEETKVAVEQPEVKQVAVEQPEVKQVAVETTVSYDDAAKAITGLAAKKGKAAAVELLSKFGAKKLPEVNPADFAELIAEANQLLAQDAAA